MKKIKKLLILPLIIACFVQVLLFSACGNENTNNDVYTITISDELPQGINSISLSNEYSAKKGEDVNFHLALNSAYTIGELKVHANDKELSSTKSQTIGNEIFYFYCISNVNEDVEITFTGTTQKNDYEVSCFWVDNFSTQKIDDKNIDDFFVDVQIIFDSENSSLKIEYNFNSISDFKQYIKSDDFKSLKYTNGLITFWVYSKDNCESFVDGWIQCDGTSIIPQTEIATEKIEGTLVKYLKAKYSINITKNTDIYFYEEAIVRSVEIPTSVCIVNGIETNIYTSPKIILKNETGLVIDNYIDLKEAETIDAYIENVNEVWKPILDNPNLEYSLSSSDAKFVFEAGEYVSDSGSYVFKNVKIPYDCGNYANYTLYITNAKDLILADSNYSKITVTKKNIIGYTLFENEFINISNDGEYYYTKCANNMFIRIKKNYTKIQIKLSNNTEEKENITLILNNKKQNITGGYTFSRYRLDDNYNIYQISYDGTSSFYNNISLTALEN